MSDTDPKFKAHPLGFFSDWYVAVTWPDGSTHRINGFKSEAHANGWIAQESAMWTAKIQRRLPPA